MRPLLRFDGFYICKLMYRRTGLSVSAWNNPVHEVVSYKYIKFNPDGSAMSLYTNSTPKSILPKIKQHMSLKYQNNQEGEFQPIQ